MTQPAPPPRLKLPIGIQTLREIREEGYYYVDKTPYVAQLAHGGKYYFLSRPRRFGKSLFLDTLAEAFEGNQALFTGLHLETNWDWSKRYPVLRISFGAGRVRDAAELDVRIREILHNCCADLGVEPAAHTSTIAGLLESIVKAAHRKHGERVVVLIDEYDKPILDHLSDPAVAQQMRAELRNLYSPLKDLDAHLKLVFLTGVSKFSKVSIFSGLNNLYDITLSNEFAGICGYTDADIDTVFAPELPGLDRDEIRRWYNGYQWGNTAATSKSVYNPFDVLLLFKLREFRAHWFETGTPTFLVDWLKNRRFFTPRLERTMSTEQLLSAFDVDHMAPEAMLWQTGYLTLRGQRLVGVVTQYELGVPNSEVRSALNEALLRAWMPQDWPATEAAMDLFDYLRLGNAQGLRGHFERLYASIPHDWYRNNPMAHYEGYWASVFYSHMAALGLEVVPEDVNHQGQCDLSIKASGCVWVLEFKLVEGSAPTGSALAQIQAKNYAAKYRAPGTRVIELGIEFSPEQRQIVGWEVGSAVV